MMEDVPPKTALPREKKNRRIFFTCLSVHPQTPLRPGTEVVRLLPRTGIN